MYDPSMTRPADTDKAKSAILSGIRKIRGRLDKAALARMDSFAAKNRIEIEDELIERGGDNAQTQTIPYDKSAAREAVKAFLALKQRVKQ